MATEAKTKVVLIRKDGGDEKAVSRLQKTLVAFADVTEISVPNWDDLSAHEVKCAEAQAVFLELSLLPKNGTPEIFSSLPKHVTVFQTAFPTEKELAESPTLKNLLLIRDSLFLDQLSTPDLLRFLHLYLLPKRQGGITTLMEKGAVVLSEKIQNIDHVGEILDRLVQYFQAQLPSLTARLHDLRQMATGLFHEGFLRAKEANQPYPTLDFQVSASREKIAFLLRFPMGKIEPLLLKEKIFTGENYALHLAWKSSDYFLVTEYKDLKEFEITAILQGTTEYQPQRIPSLLYAAKEHGSTAENLLAAPKNYRFSLISELAYKRLDANKYTVTSSVQDLENELDGEKLTEKLKLKVQQMEQERSHLHELVQNREGAFRDIQVRLNKANMEVVQKRNEMLRILKDSEATVHQYKLKLAEMERRTAFAKETLSEAQTKAKENDHSGAIIRRLEGTIKTLEREKTAVQEKVVQEQKRFALLELKFRDLHKDLGEKDKQISDIKMSLIKAEQTIASKPQKNDAKAEAKAAAAAAAPGANAADKDLATKLKETETREHNLKQEVKKLMFKAEQAEKNSKVVQTESGEKAKLLERKLEAAKTKEIELLKKIDELNTLLKKATKVA
jgi:hypothetical protein